MDNSLGLNATIELYHFTNIKIARVKFPPRYKYAGLPFSRVLLGVRSPYFFAPSSLVLFIRQPCLTI